LEVPETLETPDISQAAPMACGMTCAGEWCLRENGPADVDEGHSEMVDKVQFDGAVDERKLLLAYAALKAQSIY